MDVEIPSCVGQRSRWKVLVCGTWWEGPRLFAEYCLCTVGWNSPDQWFEVAADLAMTISCLDYCAEYRPVLGKFE